MSSVTNNQSRSQLSNAFWEMAERFVSYIHAETGFSTIVCDDQGVIRKAFVRSRIGQPHAGSQKILSTPIKEIAISQQDEARNPLTKEGLNCAIVIDGLKVATFGIGGSLDRVTPVARLAAMVMAGWVRQLQQQEILHATADQVSVELRILTDKIEHSNANFEKFGQAISSAATEAAASVTTTDKILKLVQDLAIETYMLSINANIEAGRLGLQGQAFAVVAGELGRLAKDTKASMQAVEDTMNSIRTAVAHVQ